MTGSAPCTTGRNRVQAAAWNPPARGLRRVRQLTNSGSERFSGDLSKKALESPGAICSTKRGAHADRSRIRLSCGVEIVSSLVSRCAWVVAAWLGLAMLDCGSRAQASFCATLSSASCAQSSDSSESNPEVWPPVERESAYLSSLWTGLPASDSTSTGTSSAPVSSGSGTPALGSTAVELTNSEVSAYLRSRSTIQLPPPPVFGIFEPPR